MSNYKIKLILITAPILMLLGWIIVFAMVLGAIETTYVRNFGSYALIITGFFLGMLAVMFSWKEKKSEQEIQELRDKLKSRGPNVPGEYSPYDLDLGPGEGPENTRGNEIEAENSERES